MEKYNQNLAIPLDVTNEITGIDLMYSKLLRKTGAYSDALDILARIVTKEKSQEAYLKSKKEVQTYISIGDLDNALSLANFYAQSDNFSKDSNAEFRRFKGKIYAKLGNYSMAERCYKNAFQGNPKNIHIIFGLGKLMAQQHPNPTPAEATEIMCCFLTGIQHRIGKYKSYIPRILNLLEICDDPKHFIEQSEKIAAACSPWLLQILKKHEKSPLKTYEGIIRYHIENNPQALFYLLRNFLENKDISMERGLPTTLIQVYLELKKYHSIMIQNLESLCNSLITHFKPTLEEELYSIFTNLLYSPTTASLEEYKSIFELVYQKFFLNKEHDEIIDKYHEEFRLAFSENNFKNLETVMKNIKKWKDRLAIEIKQYSTQYIDQECIELSNFYSKEIEIPFSSENPVIIERILPKILTIKSKNCNKAITFKGSNYKEYDFIISYQSSNNVYHISQLVNCLQQCFYTNSSKINHRIRGSNFESNSVQPLGCKYFLTELKAKTVSLTDIYEITINEENQDPEFWIDVNNYDIPNNLFASYMQRILQSPNRYALFRKQLTAQ